MTSKKKRKRRPERVVYWNMLSRCLNQQAVNYARYGGRGVTICDRWLGQDGFANFVEDMGPRPSANHSLERINNEGDYCPTNCRWATRSEQGRNKRNNRRLFFAGLNLTLAEWAERTGLPYCVIRQRAFLNGWSVARALTTPLRKIARGKDRRLPGDLP